MTEESQPYVEEAFGILTDDDVYLDAILVRPANTADEDLRSIRVWVPRYPLTKSSVITCAREEVSAHGPDGTSAHLVFDLRGTGYSEGQRGNTDFAMDLKGVRLWAQERFGEINFGFLGSPFGSEQVDVRPIRPGVVMETYHYHPEPTPSSERPPLLYLATYGNFTDKDDALCVALAKAGYEVFGMDPLRYLLHASSREKLSVKDLLKDLENFLRQVPGFPIMIGQPVSAGLALLWTSGVERVRGVISIGRSQLAFTPSHIFKNENPHTFFLSRHVHKIPPRPVLFVFQKNNRLGGDRDEMAALYQTTNGPRRLKQVSEISPQFLFEQLEWLTAASS